VLTYSKALKRTCVSFVFVRGSSFDRSDSEVHHEIPRTRSLVGAAAGLGSFAGYFNRMISRFACIVGRKLTRRTASQD
jgi:hypothetical protein